MAGLAAGSAGRAEIRDHIQAGRPGHAAQKLAALLSRRPDWDEVVYLLGTCEKARGRGQAAAEIWSRIPPGSPFAAGAIQGRMDVEIRRGRLSVAEDLLKQALDDPRIDSSGLPVFLGLVYCQQGGLGEAERLIEATWDRYDAAGQAHSERAMLLLLLHTKLRLEPMPDEAVRAYLDDAARLAPKDDRVWLARANLAIRAGNLEEAGRWLDECLRRCPEDPAVWHSRLNWAVAADQVEAVREAAGHIPDDESSRELTTRLAAWLAGRRGDAEAERRALERLLETGPAEFPALDRLIALADRTGPSARAEDVRRRKAAIQEVMDRYRFLDQRNQPARDAVEMARLAEQLGQRFEAQAFLTMAVLDDPRRDDLRREMARLRLGDGKRERPGRTLAESLAVELDAADPRRRQER
jgi:tetratricopeptide (TPR) repeat protein